MDSKSSKKILKIGQDLADEIDGERKVQPLNPAFAFESRFGEEEEALQTVQDEDEEVWGEEEEDMVEEVVSSPACRGQRSLSDRGLTGD